MLGPYPWQAQESGGCLGHLARIDGHAALMGAAMDPARREERRAFNEAVRARIKLIAQERNLSAIGRARHEAPAPTTEEKPPAARRSCKAAAAITGN
jgi:hypothetical protein